MRGPGYNLTSTVDNIVLPSTMPSNRAATNFHGPRGIDVLIPMPSTTQCLKLENGTPEETRQTPKAKPTFFGLPLELREKIYRHVAGIKTSCGRGRLSSCNLCKDRAARESGYEQLFAPECHLGSEDFAELLRKSGSTRLVSKQMEAKFLKYLVPYYSLTLRVDLQEMQFTDCYNTGLGASYKQSEGFKHTHIPARFARLLTRCDIFVCENQLWDDQSMARLGAALKDMPDFKFAAIHWTIECEAHRGQNRFFRAVRHVKLEEGTWTGFSRRINVTSLPDVTVEEGQKYYGDYC